MDEFTERLSRLQELSPEELTALETELVAAFDAADASADLAQMQAIADALDEVRAEKANRVTDEEAEAPEAEAPEAAPVPVAADASAATALEDAPVAADPEDEDPEESAPEAPEPEEEPTEEEAPDSTPPVIQPDDTPEEEAVVTDAPEAVAPEADPTPESNPVPIVKVGDSPSQESEEQVAAEITADEVPEEHSLDAAPASAPFTIRAGGDIPGITSGSELADMDAVSVAMANKLDTMRGGGGSGRIIVASMRNEGAVPEERTLKLGDAFGNAKKIRDLISDKEALRPEALIAAAWCAPRAPIYDVPTMGTTRRPVRDALPSFTADRGGVVWMEPPAFPDLSDAVSLWRHDGTSTWESFSDPTGTTVTDPINTKPCFTVPCGDEQTADLDALPMCLCFDNLTARAFPEWVRGNTDLTMIAQARFAEQVALAQMFGVSATGSCGSVATNIGVARDFLTGVRMSAAQLRWKLRLDADAPLQLLAPAWVATAIAIDLGLQQPGDDTLVTSNSEVNGYFGEFNVSPIWYIDDVPGTAAFTSCAAFPAAAHWLLFPTGAFVRLDNGELNLGVTRSKEDIQANRYCEFVETFETTVYMGPNIGAGNGWLIRGLTTVEILGSSSAPVDLTV